MPQRFARARAALLVLLAALPVRAAAPTDLRRLFPESARIELPASSDAMSWELELPARVLAQCRPDLSDLRILDERGVQVPFVLDRATRRPASTTKLTRINADILAADRRESPRKGAPNLFEETYELRAPPAPPAGTRWQLVLESGVFDFVRQLRVTNKPARGKPSELASDSIFRLQNGQAERLRTELAEANTPRIVVSLSGEGTSALEPQFSYEALEQLPARKSARIPLDIAGGDADLGAHIELLRPPGIVPSSLGIETTTLAFERRVEVRDAGQASQRALLGAGLIFRRPGNPPVEGLEIPLAAANGQRLEVAIDNGDSPALEALSFSAIIATPSLHFALPAGQSATLYFGGGRAHAPRYDVSLLLHRTAQTHAAANLAESQPNPAFDRTPALAFAMRPGARVDDRLYTHQRKVQLNPSSDGLARVTLGADDLAWLRPDYADLRIVDAAGQQWPYLLQPAEHTETSLLSIGETERAGKATRHTFRLPFSAIAATALEIDIAESYFDRAYRLNGESPDGKPLELARGRFTRSASDDPEPLVIDLSTARVRSFQLEVDDGDNAPLPIRAVRARVAAPSLYIPAEPGEYRLLIGNPTDTAPSYDIEHARELVLAVASRDNPAEPLAPNPAYSKSARMAGSDGVSHAIFWVALVIAVIVLGGLTLRLSRQSGPTQSA